MASVGRELCHTAIETASDLRRYANALETFGDDAPGVLLLETRELARRLEALVYPVLEFEGELRPELMRAPR